MTLSSFRSIDKISKDEEIHDRSKKRGQSDILPKRRDLVTRDLVNNFCRIRLKKRWRHSRPLFLEKGETQRKYLGLHMCSPKRTDT